MAAARFSRATLAALAVLGALAALATLVTLAALLSGNSTAAAPLPAQADLAHAVVLDEAAARLGAVCLDGSPPRYYVRPGRGAGQRKWLVFHPSGGWCGSAADCARHAHTPLGSSRPYPDRWAFDGEFLTTNRAVNPLMHDWNLAVLVYCDGGSLSGNASAPVRVGAQTLYYRGARILAAFQAALVARHALGAATDVVSAGISAGAHAALLHADGWAALVPPGARVAALLDSGFFLDWPGRHAYGAAMAHVWQAMQPVLPAACAAQYASPVLAAAPHPCLLAEHAVPFVRTPLFVFHSMYDVWQQQHVLGSTTDAAAINAFGAALLARVEQSVLAPHPANAAFVDSCARHAYGATRLRAHGSTMADAFALWYTNQTERRLWAQRRPYPCAACCTGQSLPP